MNIKKTLILLIFCGIIVTKNQLSATTEEIVHQEKNPVIPLTAESEKALDELLTCIAEEETAAQLNFAIDLSFRKRFELFKTYFLVKFGAIQEQPYQKKCKSLRKLNLDELSAKDRSRIERGINSICEKYQAVLNLKKEEYLEKHRRHIQHIEHQTIARIRGNSDREEQKKTKKPQTNSQNEGGEKPQPTPPRSATPMDLGDFRLKELPEEDLPRGMSETDMQEDFLPQQPPTEDIPRGLTGIIE